MKKKVRKEPKRLTGYDVVIPFGSKRTASLGLKRVAQLGFIAHLRRVME
jgi:hypothetical protein